jgi:cardiolipin synthase
VKPTAVVRALGISRLVIAGALVVCGMGQWWKAATVLLVVGFITDAYDGSLARHWAVASRAGAQLDHATATVMVAAAAVAACLGGLGLTWLCALMVSGAGYAVWYLRRRKLIIVQRELPGVLVIFGVLAYPMLVLIYTTLFATHGFSLGQNGGLYVVGLFSAMLAVIGTGKATYISQRYNDIVHGSD